MQKLRGGVNSKFAVRRATTPSASQKPQHLRRFGPPGQKLHVFSGALKAC
jgi:hypothetical protein